MRFEILVLTPQYLSQIDDCSDAPLFRSRVNAGAIDTPYSPSMGGMAINELYQIGVAKRSEVAVTQDVL